MIRLRKPLLAQFLFLISLLGAFRLLDYATLGEVVRIFGGVCTIVLYLWLAFSGRMTRAGFFIVLLPSILVPIFVLFYAYLFTLRTGASLLPSVLAQRDLVFYLIGPIIYMLHMREWRLVDFERLFVLAASLTIIDHLVAYFLMVSPQLWFHQGLPAQQGAWGYEAPLHVAVRAVQVVALFAALYFLGKVLQSKGILAFGIGVGMVTASFMLLATDISRTLLASIILTLIFYTLALGGQRRMRLSMAMLPILLLAATLIAPYLSSTFVRVFGQDQSYQVRSDSAEGAWSMVQEYPLLGYGKASAQSMSFQEIAGPYFQTADIGLLGIVLQYGMVGLLLYLILGVWLFVNMLRLFWEGTKCKGRSRNVFVRALLIMCLIFLISSPLQAKFVVREGIIIAAFCWGLIVAHKHGLAGGIYSDPAIRIKPLTMSPQVHSGIVHNK